ncbi:hypothetical protein C0991_005972 [Blastosporella zonata]|nr:hypothetical protein C0991_005972 [Blastosporella zonata]
MSLPSIRPSMYPPSSMYAPWVQTPRSFSGPWVTPSGDPLPLPPYMQRSLRLPQATPWTQPRTIPELPPHAHLFPPIEVVPNVHPHAETDDEYLEPGTFPAVAFGTNVPVRLHPDLIYNPADPAVPMLEWDISHKPEMSKRYTGRMVYVLPNLLEKATLPPMPNMWIYSDHPVLAAWMKDWGPIMINTADCKVRDLLDEIYAYMRQPLTERDMERVEMAGERLNLERSARQRVRDGHELKPVAMKTGFMRVDVLGGARKFLGLRAVVHQDRSWVVYMGLTSLPVAYS